MRPPSYIYPVIAIAIFVTASGVMWWQADVSEEERVNLPPVASVAAVEKARKRVQQLAVEVGKLEQKQQELESTLARLKRSETLKANLQKLSKGAAELPHPKRLRDPGSGLLNGTSDSGLSEKVLESYYHETGISPDHIDKFMRQSR